jgi:hypothetical protein
MFFWYSMNPETEEQPEDSSRPRPTLPTANPFKEGTVGQDEIRSFEMKTHQALHVNICNTKEKVHLKYYHFTPLVRYYLVIKDQNPSDVEGLFRVNSLSSFTLGIAQICGILFTQVSGAEMDIFMKINIASQIINWSITALYFGSPICALMKGSFKVDTLMQNSVTTLRKEYESYLHAVDEAQRTGGGEEQKRAELAFHAALNYEISAFMQQPMDLTVLPMEEKYLLRLAVRRRMYATYAKIH